MTHTLIMGRDLNYDGTDVGPEVVRLLQVALQHQQDTDSTLVVAACHSPDYPGQPITYAEMMAKWLRSHGAAEVVVLKSDHFSSWGELEAFKIWCDAHHIIDLEVLGFKWHLARVLVEARQVGGRKWARDISPVPVPDQPKRFDRLLEPFKWLKLLLPRPWQLRAISFWKKRISRRTSY